MGRPRFRHARKGPTILGFPPKHVETIHAIALAFPAEAHSFTMSAEEPAGLEEALKE